MSTFINRQPKARKHKVRQVLAYGTEHVNYPWGFVSYPTAMICSRQIIVPGKRCGTANKLAALRDPFAPLAWLANPHRPGRFISCPGFVPPLMVNPVATPRLVTWLGPDPDSVSE